MRKIQKKHLLTLIDTLISAGEELRTQTGQSLINLCADMQDFSASTLSFIYNVLPEHSHLTDLFDDLYKNLYFLTLGQDTTDTVQKLVQNIKETIENTKPDKIEAAFFCYKASMSDSLESIYLAAKQDPACDAYFIPIPYFERSSDNSFSKACFEAEGYYSDDYVLTNWRDYDVEARHPDIIFIMNPYDNLNFVTSVHPDYYSSRLKNFTDALVYVDYGLPFWIVRNPYTPEMKNLYHSKPSMRPAHVHSDYVISYSKELAEGYIPMFEEQPEIMRRHGMTTQTLRKKFIALGSPKFDKVLHAQKDSYPLPEEWEKKMKGKKVVLYNTSIDEMLKSTVPAEGSADELLYFTKLKELIATFKNCEDVILWWRPHPLLECTLRSMRGFLYDTYRNIVQDFISSDIGIFDTTDNLHRAIVWSDAMISDESSLLLLYTALGKPFYIPAISNRLPEPMQDNGSDFQAPLNSRLENMRCAKGANIGDWNCCIWWDNFLEEDRFRNIHFNNYAERFLDFVLHPEHYPNAEEHRLLQLQMYQDFVVNPDGTAGQKIYDYIKVHI